MMRPATRIATVFLALALGCADRPAADRIAWLSINAEQLDEVIKEHAGRVVVVDFWGTWCGPCLKLFPHTAELQREFGHRGLTVITVDLDSPAQHAAARRILEEHGRKSVNFFASYGVGPEAFSAFGIDDGALPHLRLYDAQGRLVKTFTSGGRAIDPNEVRQEVAKLVK